MAFSAWKNWFAQVPAGTQLPKLPMVIAMNELLCEFVLPAGTVPPSALSPSPAVSTGGISLCFKLEAANASARDSLHL